MNSVVTKGENEKFCSECGVLINVKAEICPKCGVRQMASPVSSNVVPAKSKFVAGMLGMFLGWLGIHKFYLGKGNQGLLYLLFFWTGIPLIIGFIEGLNYLTMSDKVFADRYL